MINGEEWFLMHDLNNFFKLKNKVAFFKLVERRAGREKADGNLVLVKEQGTITYTKLLNKRNTRGNETNNTPGNN